MLSSPGGSKRLQVQLMVCAHMKEAGYRGAVATLQRLTECCRWFRMEEHVTEFVSVPISWNLERERRCLVRLGRPCTAPGRAKLSTSTIYIGASGPLGDDGLDEDGGYSYVLVMMDDMSNCVWLEPTGHVRPV